MTAPTVQLMVELSPVGVARARLDLDQIEAIVSPAKKTTAAATTREDEVARSIRRGHGLRGRLPDLPRREDTRRGIGGRPDRPGRGGGDHARTHRCLEVGRARIEGAPAAGSG